MRFKNVKAQIQHLKIEVNNFSRLQTRIKGSAIVIKTKIINFSQMCTDMQHYPCNTLDLKKHMISSIYSRASFVIVPNLKECSL